ncbi:lipooligosaccharide transport system permease protein [Tamaricihabitans halophyticus]|uniref:Transport permease protein n=1 Tax=Tamaricihabitans halophyticus TaxID=1262583 RepID=A0A4R2QHF4_9PSEU|nr:ABC transporter permease [Tamaricihabitans halophyticus]TCP48587.1 lipooligosaccharide transport system permease protein [Tamaricihabitans halophyticus]
MSTTQTDTRVVSPLLRIAPTGMYARRARMLVERSVLVSRKMWLIILSGFFEPLFYLLAFQVGFGKLVETVQGPGGQTMSYVAFVAPALLASSAMNGAVYDSTFNIFFKMRYQRLYEGVLATPLGPLDIAMGEISWALVRGVLYAVAFFAVVSGMGLVTSPWALLMVPVAILIAFAFAAIGMAATTWIRSTTDFGLIQLVLIPMFLFSTTFFPLSVFPGAVQVIIQIFPLYHGVELMRGLATGVLDPSMLGHLAYLVVLAVVGMLVAARRLRVLLLR